MSIRRRSFWILALAAAALAAPARAANIVNIDARYYGYEESPAPIPDLGTTVTPISQDPTGDFKRLTLNAGVYKVTNAVGDPDALYDAFQYSDATDSNNWTWNFLITNATAGNKVVLFGGRNVDIHPTRAAAADAALGYEGYFAVTSPDTVLNFMVRDNSLGDNSGGVSLRIEWFGDLNPSNDPPAVPEPAALAMLALGALLPVGILARRRRAG